MERSPQSAFKIDRRVRQGCILSAHRFNVFTEAAQEEAERLIGIVNNIGKERLLKFNVKRSIFSKVGTYSPMNKLRWLNISNISAR